MPAFRRILERLDEYVRGVPNRDLPAEHFDALEPDAQRDLLQHVAQNPNPLFVQDDSVTATEPAAAPEPQQVVAPESPADDAGQMLSA